MNGNPNDPMSRLARRQEVMRKLAERSTKPAPSQVPTAGNPTLTPLAPSAPPAPITTVPNDPPTGFSGDAIEDLIDAVQRVVQRYPQLAVALHAHNTGAGPDTVLIEIGQQDGHVRIEIGRIPAGQVDPPDQPRPTAAAQLARLLREHPHLFSQ
jgi:hypothetical protein